jgi:hypothetical protein
MSVVLGRRLLRAELVLHKDDDFWNNDPSNLYIGSYAENFDDAVRNGGRTVGDRHKSVKIPDALIPEIVASEETNVFWAKKLGVGRGLISMIRHGKRRVRV